MEAVALFLCGRLAGGENHIFTARKIVLIPHDRCVRTPASITWPTDFSDPLVQEAMKRGMAILKVHSHPGGYDRFRNGRTGRTRASYVRYSELRGDPIRVAVGAGVEVAEICTTSGAQARLRQVKVPLTPNCSKGRE